MAVKRLSLYIAYLLVVQCRTSVLQDLSGGWCRSYKFATNIAGNTLRLMDLDGGLLPNDEDGSHNYMIELPLDQSLDLNDGSTYRMSLIDTAVPELKGQAFWSDINNQTLFTYGGTALVNLTSGDGTWLYDVASQQWSQQTSSVKPIRLESGASANVPSAQAGFWVGGFHSSGITTADGEQTQEYATGMLAFNTTTQDSLQVGAPFTPVLDGALIHLPYGDQGILIFLGGETPSALSGTHLDETATPNSWSTVHIYDIATSTWYQQTVTGSPIPRRTQFCAVAAYDAATSSHQIWVMGGADYTQRNVLTDVSYLSIPSFTWYTAASLPKGRMTHTCEILNRQMFAVGGRLAWYDDQRAGCYTDPAFIYDLVAQEASSTYNPNAAAYSAPAEAVKDIKANPYPSSWASPALEKLFVPQASSSTNGTSTSPSPTSTPSSSSKITLSTPAIAGIALGSTLILLLILATAWIMHVRRISAALQASNNRHPIRGELDDTKVNPIHEMEVAPTEMEAGEARHEMLGQTTWPRRQEVVYEMPERHSLRSF